LKEKKLKNILFFLEDLSKGKIICIDEYAKKLNITPRTMQRYKKEVEEFFNIKFIKIKRGCYQFPNPKKIESFLINEKEFKDFEKFIDIVAHLKPQMLKFLNIDEKIIKKLVPRNIIFIKDSIMEEFFNTKYFNTLKHSIKHQKCVDIEYFSDKEYFFEDFKPYRIVFAEGNWYLCGISNDDINNGFKFLRISFIKNITSKSATFKKDKEVVEFIESFDSILSRFKEKKREVIVEVDKSVERFFRVKKFLPSQEILKSGDNLTIRYYITSDEEILFLAKRWLPHMKIIKPKELQEKLLNLVKEFLEK